MKPVRQHAEDADDAGQIQTHEPTKVRIETLVERFESPVDSVQRNARVARDPRTAIRVGTSSGTAGLSGMRPNSRWPFRGQRVFDLLGDISNPPLHHKPDPGTENDFDPREGLSLSGVQTTCMCSGSRYTGPSNLVSSLMNLAIRLRL